MVTQNRSGSAAPAAPAARPPVGASVPIASASLSVELNRLYDVAALASAIEQMALDSPDSDADALDLLGRISRLAAMTLRITADITENLDQIGLSLAASYTEARHA